MLTTSVRLGAAAFVLGLSLAAPQAVGVASADSTGVAASSAGSADQTAGSVQATPSKRSTVSRAGRAPVASSEGATHSTIPGPAEAVQGRLARASVPAGSGAVPAADTTGSSQPQQQPRPASAVRALSAESRKAPAATGETVVAATVGGGQPTTGSAVSVPVVAPLASAAEVDPVGVVPAAETPTLNQSACGSCWAFSASLPGQAIATAGFTIEHLMDTVGTWLSSLPTNPITDFLSGGLWLLRRAVFPVGSGVGEWGSAACVTATDCSGQNLTGADLVGHDLAGVNFDGATLTSDNLNGAHLNGDNLNGLNLAGANLAGADLTNVDLSYSDLTGANLSGAKLFDGSLEHANLTEANLRYADLRYADLYAATMALTDLQNANLTDANLHTANLWGADLIRASLVRADLRNTNLFGSYLGGADLTDARLNNSDLRTAQFISTNLTGANLSYTDLSGAYLYESNLTDATLLGATLYRWDEVWLGSVHIYDVTWKNTTCPDGSTTNAGCLTFAAAS